MRPTLSRRYVKSGSTRSIPSISMFGNMSPQSSNRMRPSTSMHAQLRPISPSPPRNVTVTGSGMQRGVHLSGSVFGARGRRPQRQTALPDPQPQRAHHRFDRLGEDTGVAVLEQERVDELGVDLAGPYDIALLEGGDHLAELGPGPMRGRPDDTDRADGEQRQGHTAAAAVDVEGGRIAQQARGRRR